MNTANAEGRSAQNWLGSFARSWNKNPPAGRRIGDAGAPGAAWAISAFTDSPLSGTNAAM
jgi:hypothetical protein